MNPIKKNMLLKQHVLFLLGSMSIVGVETKRK